jgi:MATE family multidrug resistance protein
VSSTTPSAASHAEIVGLAVPAMLALAADPLLSLVDTALVGRLGTVPLAALGVNTAVFTATFWLFNFLTYGTTAEVARLRGAGRPDEAAVHALQALGLALALGVGVLAVLEAAGPWIVAAMGADGDVAGPALGYLRVRALASVPMLVVAVGHGAFRGLKDTPTPLWVAVGANGVNAVASYVLIYPVGLGIVGAAWGTVLAQTGAALVFLVLAKRRFPVPELRLDPVAMRSIVRISRDLFLRTASLLTALVIATAMAARIGVVTVAAHQIARELWSMMALVLDGFAIAGQALIGSALGARRPDVARADARKLLRWGLAGGVAIGAGYLALSGPLPGVFTTDERVLAEVRSVWWLIALMQPICGVVFVLDGVLMGASDYRFLLWSTALAGLAGLVPLAAAAWLLGWGLAGIWWGMTLMMVIRLVTITARVRDVAWTVSTRGA